MLERPHVQVSSVVVALSIAGLSWSSHRLLQHHHLHMGFSRACISFLLMLMYLTNFEQMCCCLLTYCVALSRAALSRAALWYAVLTGTCVRASSTVS
jgi:hypothetical protein